MSVMTPRIGMCNGTGYNGAPRGGRFGGEMEGPVAPQRRYTLSENFYNVLADVGAEKDKQYEWKDVIMLFLRYLAKRKPSLFDPENKSRVMCQGDPLGRVFGVSSFTKDETRMLVRQQISLVEDEALYASLPPLPGCSNSVPRPPAGADAERAKRGPTADADDPDSKRSRSEQAAAAGEGSSEVPPPPTPAQLHRMDTIEASDDDEDDGVDAPLVAAMAAAAAARAGRDDADDDRRTYARELEPVDGTDLAESDSDSSSGDSDFAESPLHLTMLTVWMDDVGMMADMETSESDTENQDTWMCSAPDCRHSNKARRSRCDKCWRTRPAWVVGPPRRRRRRRRERAGMTEAMRRSLAPKPASSAPAAASTSSATAATTSASEASDAKQESSADTGYGSQEAVLPSPPSPPPQPQPVVDQTCIICCEKNRDAAIIHGLTGCQVTCYQCARKLWKKKDLCPSCRRTIEKIVYMRFG